MKGKITSERSDWPVRLPPHSLPSHSTVLGTPHRRSIQESQAFFTRVAMSTSFEEACTFQVYPCSVVTATRADGTATSWASASYVTALITTDAQRNLTEQVWQETYRLAQGEVRRRRTVRAARWWA